MIQKVEVWDFECHEHSMLADLSPGLNLIYGESDSGKSSLVRALKVAAYNEFDPSCVRTGAKNCRIRVETERGYVMVTRGKDNLWEVCKTGQIPQHFMKIGTNVLPDAAEVIGLHKVELGDLSLSVNIMDQSEAHFMLNELGGKSASGSTRAQIVDEISGLSGIEGLIKEVSLDRHRLGRAVKEHEDKANEFRASMHDKKELVNEEKLLLEVGDLVKETEQANRFIQEMAQVLEEHFDSETSIESLNKEIGEMPNTKSVLAFLLRSEEFIRKEKNLISLQKEHETAHNDLNDAESSLNKIPDVSNAEDAIAQAAAVIKKYERAIDRATDIADQLEELEELEQQYKNAMLEEKEAIQERDEAMANVDVCPLTLAPVSSHCLNNLKVKITKENHEKVYRQES